MENPNPTAFVLRGYMETLLGHGVKSLCLGIIDWAKKLDDSAAKQDILAREEKTLALQDISLTLGNIDGVAWQSFVHPKHKITISVPNELFGIIYRQDGEALMSFGTRAGFKAGKTGLDLSGKSICA